MQCDFNFTLDSFIFHIFFYRTILESHSKCIPESNGNMYVATASRTSECTSLVILRWHNSNERSSNTTGSNKRFTNGTTATITNCNASLEFQSGKTLYTGHLSRRWSYRRNTSNGKARKHGMTIGNAQSGWYRSVNVIFSFSLFVLLRNLIFSPDSNETTTQKIQNCIQFYSEYIYIISNITKSSIPFKVKDKKFEENRSHTLGERD